MKLVKLVEETLEDQLTEGVGDLRKTVELPEGLKWWNYMNKYSDGDSYSVTDAKSGRSLLSVHVDKSNKMTLHGSMGMYREKTSMKTLVKDIVNWIKKYDGKFKMPDWGMYGT